ncbi:MAG TPA: hypothetical protein VFM93_06600 [Candidatus Limnocylindria bacterium]|nr:hypothetical protein [Candidatus Limnocylindria bacterium]
MTRRVAIPLAVGVAAAAALVGLYLGLVTWAQGPEHAVELLSGDRAFVALIAAGFGTQVGLFAYVRALRRELARAPVAVAGAGTAASSVSMIACCAHHLTDVLPVVGVSGLAVLLVELKTPLMLVGIATSALGVAVMVREMRRIRGAYRLAVAGAAA